MNTAKLIGGYHDSRDGVRAVLAANGYPERSGTDVVPDPVVRGVWAVRFEADGSGAIVDLRDGSVTDVEFAAWPPRVVR